jgi:TonB family protein
MMTPSKETLEVGNASAESAAPQSNHRSKPDSAHLRADAVSLEIPVKVHGSVVKGPALGAAPQAQPFEEPTSTMIVFPQGGVLKMSTSVSAGQVMVLTNLKSHQDAICRVVKSRAYGNGQSYVEVEFTSRQPGYWGVYFPSDGADMPKIVTPVNAPVAASSSLPAAPEKPVSDISWAPASAMQMASAKELESAVRTELPPPPSAPSRHSAQPAFPESRFVSIGSQEDVQPAAASTSTRLNPSANTKPKHPADADDEIGAAIDALFAPAASINAAPSLTDADGEAAAAPRKAKSIGGSGSQTEAAPQAVGHTLPESAAGNPSAPAARSALDVARPARQEMFGVRLDSASLSAEHASTSNRSRVLIPIGVAAVLALIAGAAFYFHTRPGANATLNSSAVVAGTRALPTGSQNSSAPAQPSAPGAVDAARPISNQTNQVAQSNLATPASDDVRAPKAETTSREHDAGLSAREREGVNGRDKARAAASEVPDGNSSKSANGSGNVAIPSTFGALQARPVVSGRGDEQSAGSAPVLQAGGSPAAGDTVLSGGIAVPPPNVAAPPQPAPSEPLRVGGKVLPPKLVSSVLPIYPPLAQEAGISGNVVIDATIDKDGKVAKMKVLSGPPVLRASALSALSKWRYEPSMLNGQPISIQMIVSIQFRP